MSSAADGAGGGGGEDAAPAVVATIDAPAASNSGEELSLHLKEMTEAMQKRGVELDALRVENATLKSAHEASLARISSLESQLAQAQSSHASGDASASAASTALLASKDAELAGLRSKSNQLVNKLEQLESEVVVTKKRSEMAVAKIAAEKDDEIVALKEMFTQISEKRKESFLQLKDRLRTASEMLQRNQEQHAADAKAIVDLQAQVEQLTRGLNEKSAQVSDYESRVHSLEHEKGDLFQRTSDELQKSKSEVREGAVALEVARKELDRVTAVIKLAEEKVQKQADADMSLESEGGIAENGRSVRLVYGTPLPSNTPMQWYRSFRGASFLPIAGTLATEASYTPTVDDIGATLKLEIMLGPRGAPPIPVSREFGPIGAKRNMVIAIHEHIKKADMVFNVDSAYTDPKEAATAAAAKNKPQILLNREKIKLRAGGKTIAKAGYSDELLVTMDQDSSTKFTVRVDAASNPISYAAPNSVERDSIVQTIRSFNQTMINLIKKIVPADAILALAYLIRSSNESRTVAQLKQEQAARSPRGGGPAHLRDRSDDFGFLAGTGVTPGSHPSSPNHASSQLASRGVIPDTPRSTAGGGGTTPAASSASSATPSKSPATTPAAAAVAAAAAPVAVAKIKGSNGEELEVDADGFVIRKDVGWGDSKPESSSVGRARSNTIASKLDRVDDDDSDFSAGEDELETKPSFQMKINAESRPAASADALRKSVFGLGGGLGGVVGLAMAKEKKKKEKREKKEGKEGKKKKKDASAAAAGSPIGEEVEGAFSPASSNSQTQGSPQSSTQPDQTHNNEEASSSPAAATAATGSASAAYNLAVNTGNHSPVNRSPRQSVDRKPSMAAAATPVVASAAAPTDPDDLFAFLDSEAHAKAPPSLGVSPKPVAPVAASAASAASSSSTAALVTASPSPSPAKSSPSSSASSGSSTSVSASPLGGGSSEPQVDILVMETLHARILDGEVIEWAVWGEILLNLNAPNPSAPVRFDFQIFNSDSMQKVAPNSAVLTAGPQGSYVAMIPAGTDAPLCVMKYKVDTDLARAKKQVPIELTVKWQCTKQNTVIDVDYKATQGSNTPLMDLKFLIAVAPEKCIKQCTLAVPKCMWSPQSQKMMWQIPALDSRHSSGQLHAELVNADVACHPAPLSVSFMSDDLESVLSGILVMEGDRKAGSGALPLGRLIYRLKSGIFTVL